MIIWRIIHAVPDVVWSGVIGSLITLLGVVRMNRANVSILNKQLQHDSIEKEKDRLGRLRRDVYLVAAEESTRAINLLSSLPMIDPVKFSSENLLHGFFSSMAKLQLVSENKTALLVGEFLSEFSIKLLNFMNKAKPIYDINIELDIRSPHYDKAQSEIVRIISKMSAANEAGEFNPVAFATLKSGLDYEQNRANQLSKERSELFNKRNNFQIEYVKNLLPEMADLQKKLSLVMVEIRREFGVNTDIEEFSRQMKAQVERLKGGVDAFMRDFGKQE